MGIEPMTSSLPRKCSTAELRRLLICSKFNSNSLIIKLLISIQTLERKTRFELATYSLEGYRSTNWATSAFLITNYELVVHS